MRLANDWIDLVCDCCYLKELKGHEKFKISVLAFSNLFTIVLAPTPLPSRYKHVDHLLRRSFAFLQAIHILFYPIRNERYHLVPLSLAIHLCPGSQLVVAGRWPLFSRLSFSSHFYWAILHLLPLFPSLFLQVASVFDLSIQELSCFVLWLRCILCFPGVFGGTHDPKDFQRTESTLYSLFQL